MTWIAIGMALVAIVFNLWVWYLLHQFKKETRRYLGTVGTMVGKVASEAAPHFRDEVIEGLAQQATPKQQ